MVARHPHWEVSTFRDALGLALNLESHYHHGHFAAVVGPEDQVLQISARFAGPGATTVGLFDEPCRALWRKVAMGGGSVVVLSVDADGIEPLDADESIAYLRHRRELSRAGIDLRDWIRTDGDVYQSAAYSLHPDTAWPDDPLTERLEELLPPRHEASRPAPP